jgi:hypothetical protein
MQHLQLQLLPHCQHKWLHKFMHTTSQQQTHQYRVWHLMLAAVKLVDWYVQQRMQHTFQSQLRDLL